VYFCDGGSADTILAKVVIDDMQLEKERKVRVGGPRLHEGFRVVDRNRQVDASEVASSNCASSGNFLQAERD
jgi:hypothetical protein